MSKPLPSTPPWRVRVGKHRRCHERRAPCSDKAGSGKGCRCDRLTMPTNCTSSASVRWQARTVANVSWPGPRRSVEALAARYGRAAVVDACVDLLHEREVDGQIIFGLGGPPARWAVDGGAPGPEYWLRVWALRGLLWLWDDSATQVVAGALADEAWRVREMAAKVVARHRLDPALDALLTLREDPVERVRTAASKGIQRLTSARESAG